MKARSLCAFLAVASSAFAAGANAPAADVPQPLTLAWCLERARAANPQLESAAASASAASARIVPAGALEDPRFAYEASNLPTNSFDFRSTPMSGNQFGLRQKLPVPGLLTNRKRAARRSAAAASFLHEDQKVSTEADVEIGWAELGFAQRALDITNRNIAFLRQLSATATSRYRVGAGLQQDVLRAQVELTALLRERLRRQESIDRAEARLAQLLDLPEATHLPRTAELQMARPQPTLESVIAVLEAESARLEAAREAVEAARASVRIAELEGLPDVDLGVGYRLRSRAPGDPVAGQDFFSAGLIVRLPVDRAKWRARAAEQRALLRRAEAELRGVRAELVARAQRAHAELTRAASEEALLETGLVPQAQQSLASSRSGYEVGRIDFLSLLDSQVRLLGAELQLVRARADKRVAFAALESAAGEKLR